MTIAETFEGNELARNIYHRVEGVSFGKQYGIVPVTTAELAQKMKDNSQLQIDFRAKISPEPGFATMFEGLAYDPDNVRSQSFALMDWRENEPVGVMTAVIAPHPWIMEQRYFQRESDGVRIRDFTAISGDKAPDYLIIPAWTKVAPEHLLRFAIPGFKAFHKMMSHLQDFAPENTWMEAVAQGQWPPSRKNELLDLASRGVGTYIHKSELPFQLDQIGKNSKGASSSIKMAPLMGLHRIEGLASARSLGPAFAKRVK